MKYIEVSVITTTLGSDIVSDILISNGSEGVNVKDDNDIIDIIKNRRSWDYADESLLSKNSSEVIVTGGFLEGTDLSALKAEIASLKESAVFDVGSLTIHISTEDSSDWENEWRKYYAPLEFNRLVVVPAWQEYENTKNLTEVKIEPGTAFGTGTHETTSLCLEMLEGCDLKNKNLADIGCGSGILGVAALKLGAERCIFSDVDISAINATKSNAELNGVTDLCKFVSDGNVSEEDFADVIAANITTDILIMLYDMILKLLKKGGYLLVSGIIRGREGDLLSAYKKDYALIETRNKGEWAAFKFQKR